jgi:uncharacterized membrane-anchored protein YitT (DUF2179 family)
MPARTFFWLIFSVILAAGLTVVAARTFNLPTAVLGLGLVGATLGLRLWGRK